MGRKELVLYSREKTSRSLRAGALAAVLAAAVAAPCRAETAPRARTSPTKENAASCDERRLQRQKDYMAAVNAPDTPFEVLRDVGKRKNFSARACFFTFTLTPDVNMDHVCTQGFEKSAEFMVRADDLTIQACSAIKAATERNAACDRGQGTCLVELAKGLKDSRKLLAQAQKESKLAALELDKLRNKSVQIAKTYGFVLTSLAGKLSERKVAGLPLDDPDLDKFTKNSLGKSVDQVLADLKLPDRDPTTLAQRAMEMQKRSGDYLHDRTFAQDFVAVQGDTKMISSFDGELSSASVSGTTSQFNEKLALQYETSGKGLDAEASRLEELGRRMETAPAEAPSEKKPPPSAASPKAVDVAATSPTPGAVHTAAGPTGPASSTSASSASSSASRLPDFPFSARSAAGRDDAPARFAPAAFRGPASGSGPMEAARSGSPAAPARVSPFEPAASPMEAPAEAPKAAAEKTKAAPSDDHAPATMVSYSVNITLSPTGGAAAGPRSSSGPSGLTGSSGPDGGDTLPPTPLAAAATAAKARAEARAEKIADAEIERMSAKSGPIPTSLRDLLRRRLARSALKDQEKQEAAARVASGSDGSTGAVAGLLREIRTRENTATAGAFGMSSLETEAEVRRLLDAQGDNEASLGSVNVTLFHRVHEAHLRTLRTRN